jgi:phthiocerol/phenolphthiocerol synthesis type-I polyketide synthase D
MDSSHSTAGQRQSVAEIEAWLVRQLAEALAVSPDEIDVRRPFAEHGLDSAEGVILAGDLEEWLGRELPSTLAWDHPNIAALAAFLGEETVGATEEDAELAALVEQIESLSEEEAQRALREELDP